MVALMDESVGNTDEKAEAVGEDKWSRKDL